MSETITAPSVSLPASLADYVACIKRGDDKSQARLFLDAANAYQQAAALKPEMYEAHFKLGNAYLALGDLLSTMKAYQEAYKRQPREIELLLRISEVCYRMKDNVKAAQMLAEILMINDRYLPALLVLPELLVSLGRIDDALDLLKAAIPAQPHIPELWVAAGIATQRQGDLDRARLFYQEALNLDPKSPVAKQNLELLGKVAA